MLKIIRVLLAVLIVAGLTALIPLAVARPAKAQTGGGGPVICLDPGHGGHDPGAIGNGIAEKDINLDIALRLRAKLTNMGYTVVMTRDADYFVGLQDRCNIATANHALLFISIHNNSGGPLANGTETYWFAGNWASQRLATFVEHDVLVRTGLQNKGVRVANFLVIKNATMPAILIEGGYLSNFDDAKQLADGNFRQKIAEAVATGLNSYLYNPTKFDEYMVVMNPDPKRTAVVQYAFQKEGGAQELYEEPVPPLSRRAVLVDDHVPNADPSTSVRSVNGVPIVAERTQYFDFDKGNGVTTSPGANPSRDWYFADGSTAWGFNTYFALQNPSNSEALAQVAFVKDNGVTREFNYKLAPNSRVNVDVAGLQDMNQADFSTSVHSTVPITAERAMYFADHYGISGGHDSPGATAPANTWYLAEGSSWPGFSTFVVMNNPGSEAAVARVTCMTAEGKNVSRTLALKPKARRSVYLNDLPELKYASYGTVVESTKPLVVERSMYFDYRGIRDGSCSAAAPAPARTWYLPEGRTSPGNDTYLLLLNPNKEPARAGMEFITGDGQTAKSEVKVPGRSRKTVCLNDIEAVRGKDVSTKVQSDRPIVVERSMYSLNGGKSGGSCSMGQTAAGPGRDFAEGCTK